MSLLGIDLGTSNCKCVAFQEDGTVIAQTTVSYAPTNPRPEWMEMDPEVFWNAFVKTVRTVTGWLSDDPVTGLAISSQGETIIPVDQNGMPVYSAFMNSDNRAKEQVAKLEQGLGKRRIYDITGLPLHTMFGGTKIMWIKENLPDVYRKTWKFLSCEDFILLRLGFGPFSSKCLCCRTLLFDVRKREWSNEMLSATGIDRSKLSEAISSGELVGRLNHQVASLLGLREGVGVATGGHDQCCSILGSGVTKDHIASDAAGTYEGVSILTNSADTSNFAFENNINTYCHLFDDQYMSLAFFPSGFAMNWMMDLLRYNDGTISKGALFAKLDTEVEKLGNSPTGIFVLPHFVGSCNPYNDTRATGTIVGLTPNARPAVLYKAIYESIAYEFAAMTRLLSNIGNYESVHISGGGSKSDFTLRLRAAISGKKVCRSSSSDSVCQGAAMLAGIATGVYKNRDDAVNRSIQMTDYFEPNAELQKAYQTSESIYHEIYHSMSIVRDRWEDLI